MTITFKFGEPGRAATFAKWLGRQTQRTAIERTNAIVTCHFENADWAAAAAREAFEINRLG